VVCDGRQTPKSIIGNVLSSFPFRLPGGWHGTSVTIRQPRAPQAHPSLGRTIYHRQGVEARAIQALQRPRRSLRKRLEHRAATSLLPLEFQAIMYSESLWIKGLTFKWGSALFHQTEPPLGARRGEPPMCHFFIRKVFSPKNDFRVLGLVKKTKP
jgi:hypothetical protein